MVALGPHPPPNPARLIRLPARSRRTSGIGRFRQARESRRSPASLLQADQTPDMLVWRAADLADDLHEAMSTARGASAVDAALQVLGGLWCTSSRKADKASRSASCRGSGVGSWPARIDDAVVSAKCAVGLLPLRRCSPAYGVGILRTWCVTHGADGGASRVAPGALRLVRTTGGR